MAKKVDAALLAALQSGAASPEAAASAATLTDTTAGGEGGDATKTPEGGDATKTPEGGDATKTPEGGDATKTPEGESGDATKAPEGESGDATKAAIDPLVAHLKSEVRETRDELQKTTTKLTASEAAATALKTENDAAKADVVSLRGIVENSCKIMAIALGGAPIAMDGMNPKALVEHHAKLSENMKKRFPTAAKASTTAAAVAEPSQGAKDAPSATRAAAAKAATM